MLARTQEIENLLRLNALKEAKPEADQIAQFLDNSRAFLNSAQLEQLATVVRYTCAYEGLCGLASAILFAYGVRPGNDKGHRFVALQLLIQHLWPGKPGVYKTVMDAAGVRNKTTYEQPRPTVTAAQTQMLASLLEEAIPLVARFVEPVLAQKA